MILYKMLANLNVLDIIGFVSVRRIQWTYFCQLSCTCTQDCPFWKNSSPWLIPLLILKQKMSAEGQNKEWDSNKGARATRTRGSCSFSSSWGRGKHLLPKIIFLYNFLFIFNYFLHTSSHAWPWTYACYMSSCSSPYAAYIAPIVASIGLFSSELHHEQVLLTLCLFMYMFV